MKLSILVCSLNSRKNFLDRLLERLCPQVNANEAEVEILLRVDNGEATIGAKRNSLVHMATGDYAAMIDDDDLVSENYVNLILGAIGTNPDCVGMQGIMTTDGHSPRKFEHSLKHRSWYEKDGIYYRNPNHLNPIKRKMVISTPFLEINYGEDADFSKRILPLLETEVFIEEPIYFYEFRTQKHEPLKRVIKDRR